MATETRPGLRLPWSGGATKTPDNVVLEETEQVDMIETPALPEASDTSDTSDTDEHADVDLPPTRRATKFMADLSRAMQAAAQTARAETMVRFEADAKTVVDEIQVRATADATDLRRRADNDVAAIREWSKAEIARIREEAEARITARKTGLDREIEQHGAAVGARVQLVAAKVAEFDQLMNEFFERLNAEADPTRIATMAETMPDPPNLSEQIAAVVVEPEAATAETPEPAETLEALGSAEALADEETPDEVDAADLNPTGTEWEQPAAIDFAAAEAEAASLSGDPDDELPTDEPESIDSGARIAVPELIGEAETARALGTSQVIVAGLVSVANIANFKRNLARTSGVSTITVASGPDGEFVFTVGHQLGSALSMSVLRMHGFDISITAESADSIHVTAQDRDDTD